jgi:hypothetical protein
MGVHFVNWGVDGGFFELDVSAHLVENGTMSAWKHFWSFGNRSHILELASFLNSAPPSVGP